MKNLLVRGFFYLGLAVSVAVLQGLFACSPVRASSRAESTQLVPPKPFPAGPGCLPYYRPLVSFQADSIPSDYLALGSVRGYMYVLKKQRAGFVNSWNSFYLGSPVRKIVADDIDANGIIDLVVLTSAGRMFIFDTNTHLLVWESTANDFASVSEFLVEQLDTDRAKELLLCADSRLVIMDGEKLLREYQSSDEFKCEYMLIGDVDNDDEKEIVLDSGFVINAKTLNFEWQTDFFGTRPSLLDVDADGVDELICESTGGALRVYDLDIRQEKTVF
jgi:hypothetical protein